MKKKKKTLFKKIAFNAAISGFAPPRGSRGVTHSFRLQKEKKKTHIKSCRTYQRGEKRSPSVINTLADNPCNLPRYPDFQPHLTHTRTTVCSPLRASLNMFVLLLTGCCHRRTETRGRAVGGGLLQKAASLFPPLVPPSACCLASRPPAL